MKKFIVLAALICGFLVSNSQSYTYIAQRYRWLAGLFEALGLPAGDSAQFKTGQRQQAGAVYYDSVGADAGFYIWTGTAWVLQGSPAAAELPDELIQPGYVTYSGTGLKFYISPSIARFNGVIYGTDYDSVTLTTADPTDPRKDVIYLATTGVEVLTGTPAGPAAEPQLDANQIKLTVVDVPAGSTVPSITTNVVYDDNLGESVVTNVGTTTDPDNTTNVYRGTKSLNVTNIIQFNQVIFTLTSSVDLTIFEGISMFLRLKAIMASNSQLWIQFYNGSTAASNEIPISFNHTSLTYQGLTIPMTSFNLTGAFADKVRIRYHQFTGVTHPGFYLDYVHFESGVPQPGGGDQLVMGSFGTQTSSPDGAVIAAGKLHMQPVTTAHYGLMSPAQKAKLDSLRSDYLMENVGDGEELATQVNDSTVGIKSLKAGTGVTLDVTDTTVTINSTAGSQTLQQTFDTEVGGSVLTKSDTILLNGFNLLIKGPGTTQYDFQPTQFNFLNSNAGSTTQITGSGGGGIDAIANFAGTNNGSVLTLADGYSRLNAQNSLGPESNIYVYPDSIALVPQGGNLLFKQLVAGSGTRSLRYDPSTNLVTYGDTASGGGSGGVQDAIDNDNVLTKADTINLNGQFLTFLNGGVGVGSSPNSLFRVGVGSNGYLSVDPTNNRYEFGDLNGLLNSTYMSIDDANQNIDFNASGAMRWGVDTLATRAYARSVGGGGSIGEWDGSVTGTSFSATSTTISSAAVQWTFTGSSPATFTLPARTSSVNQFYIIKNNSTSANLTIAADGTDDIFTTSSVTSVTLLPGESIMITGAASGTSDLWTALFHASGSGTPTWQQTLTAGSNISADVTITGGTADEWTQTMQRYRWEAYSGGGDRGKLLVLSNVQWLGHGGTAGNNPGYGFRADQTGTAFVDITAPLGEVRMSNLTAGVGTKAVRIDPSSGKLTYADTTTGGTAVSLSKGWFADTITISGVQTITNKADVFDDCLTTPNSTAGTSYRLEVPSGTGADASIGNTGTTPPNGNGWAGIVTGTTTTGSAALATTSVSLGKNIIDTTKTYRWEERIQIETLSDDTEDFRIVLGLVSSTTNTTATNQIWFRYNDNTNSGNWTCYSADGTTTESTNSGVAAAAGTAVVLAFEYDNAAINFYINGSLVATHTTRVPAHNSASLFPVIAITKTLGSTSRTVFDDYVKYRRL